MNKNLFISEENQKFVNALIKVAEILEPNVEFNDVIYQKHVNDEGTNVEYAVSGKTRYGNLVQVTKELRDSNKGLEIVVRLIDPITMHVIRERGVWYWAFNWKGIMNGGTMVSGGL